MRNDQQGMVDISVIRLTVQQLAKFNYLFNNDGI